MSSRRRSAAAALALVVLLGGFAVPFLGLLHAEEEGAAFCGAKGRCCCAREQGGSDRPCLRRACGCDRPEPTTPHAPLRVEAVLPILARLLSTERARGRLAAPAPRPFDRPDEPLVPPPRSPLPA